MARTKARPVDQGDGYSARFEQHPEYLFGRVMGEEGKTPHVVDAVVREVLVDGLKVCRIEDVLAGSNEILFGLGTPNEFTVVPKPDGTGYQKFAAFSLWRKPAKVEDVSRKAGNWVQSGVWIRLLDLPAHAAERIRAGMEKYQGQKFRTCVNGNLHVLEFAGFTCGDGKPLTSGWQEPLGSTFPVAFMGRMFDHGLFFEGSPVRYEVIRTTRKSMEEFSRGVIFAELTTFWRHFKKTPTGARVAYFLGAPMRKFHKNAPKSTSPTAVEVAPALPSSVDYADDLRVRISKPGTTGQMLRQAWGPHALFEAICDRVNVDDYLTRPLRPFPQANPNFVTKVKKAVLFSRPVIWLMRKVLVPRYVELGAYSERDVYDRLRTHSDANPNIYNIVIVRQPPEVEGGKPTTRIIMSRITVKSKLADWILSKHVLMSGYLAVPELTDTGEVKDKDKEAYVVWAGEGWKDVEGAINERGNSGTYQPEDAATVQAVSLTQAVLPHLTVKKAPMPGEEPATPAATQAAE